MEPFARKPSLDYLKRYKKDAEKFLKTGHVNPRSIVEYGFQGRKNKTIKSNV